MSENLPPQLSGQASELPADNADARALSLVVGGILGAFPDQEIRVRDTPGGLEIDMDPAASGQEVSPAWERPAQSA